MKAFVLLIPDSDHYDSRKVATNGIEWTLAKLDRYPRPSKLCGRHACRQNVGGKLEVFQEGKWSSSLGLNFCAHEFYMPCGIGWPAAYILFLSEDIAAFT